MNTAMEFLKLHGKTDILAMLGLFFSVLAYIPYFWKVANRKAKPAISTWGLWAMLTVLMFIGQCKLREVYLQTAVYIVLDPLMLGCALWMRHWSPFEREDKIAIGFGVISTGILVFFPANSTEAFIASLVGLIFATIPIWKNLLKDPEAESFLAWISFLVAGFFSTLSGIVFFTTWEGLLTPIVYLGLSIITFSIMVYVRSPYYIVPKANP